jgi:hypothetical protein
MRLLDYDYGSALGSNRVHLMSESAIHNASVRGNSPMNSLGLRTEVMLDCLELLVDSTAVTAMRDGWSDSPPPLLGRHPGEEEEEPEGEELDDEDDLDGDDFDDEDEDFDDEDFDDEEEEDIDEELDDEIDDIDVDDDEEDDFDDDDDLELDEEEDADIDDL